LGVSPEFASRLLPEDLDDVATGDIQTPSRRWRASRGTGVIYGRACDRLPELLAQCPTRRGRWTLAPPSVAKVAVLKDGHVVRQGAFTRAHEVRHDDRSPRAYRLIPIGPMSAARAYQKACAKYSDGKTRLPCAPGNEP
jgi:hypothetical protein